MILIFTLCIVESREIYLFTENNTAEDTIAAKSAMETQTMETQASPGKTTED